MDDKRYEQALTDAFTHITTQPRPAGTDLAEVIIARTVGLTPRRRVAGVRWLAAAAALVVAAGLLSWVLRPGPPIAGIPGPAPTVSIITAEATAQLSFNQDESLPYAAAQIQVDRHDQTLTITASATKDGKKATSLGSFTGHAGILWSLSVDKDLQLALLPGNAEEVISLGGGAVHLEYLGGVGMTAVAVEHDIGAAQGLIWRGDDDRVRDSSGRIIPSATLTTRPFPATETLPVTVFEDENLNLWGYFDQRNDARGTGPLDTEPIGTLKGLGATSNGGYFEEATFIGVLPTGGTDPELDTQDGVVWDSAPIGDTGRIAILVNADRVKARQTGVRSITYTDQDGTRQTYEP